MKVEKVHNNLRYTLSNENLKEGDKVFPIANGRCLDNGGWILHDFDFRDFVSGFPDEPHTIIDLNYDNGRQGKPYEVRTDKGYSPIECYYKIVKIEKQIKIHDSIFGGRYDWLEIGEADKILQKQKEQDKQTTNKVFKTFDEGDEISFELIRTKCKVEYNSAFRVYKFLESKGMVGDGEFKGIFNNV